MLKIQSDGLYKRQIPTLWGEKLRVISHIDQVECYGRIYKECGCLHPLGTFWD